MYYDTCYSPIELLNPFSEEDQKKDIFKFNLFKNSLLNLFMNFDEFINTTYQHDTFDIIDTNNNGTCCYDSILRLLKIYKKVKT